MFIRLPLCKILRLLTPSELVSRSERVEAPGVGGDAEGEAARPDAAAEDTAGGLGALRLRDGGGRTAI